MDTRRSSPEHGSDLVRQAETLVRSLTGVVNARISAADDGIHAVHVLAADDHAARAMAAHVRSALLAGLATPVLAHRIHVRVADVEQQEDDDAGDARDGDDARQAAPDRERNGHGREGEGGKERGGMPADRIRLLHPRHDDAPADAPFPVPASTPMLFDAPRAGAVGAAEPVGHAPPPTRARPRALDQVRLVAVDLERPGDGRVLCRVSVAWDARVHRAEAVAVDLPGAAAQAAAQAAVRALTHAGLGGLELNGLREVEIAGRDYVLVALRRVGPDVRHRAGSACIIGSPERSAAEAAVRAANDLI